MIITKKMAKKAMQKASALQKRTIDTADMMIAHGKEFHPLTEKCEWCENVRREFLLDQERGEL